MQSERWAVRRTYYGGSVYWVAPSALGSALGYVLSSLRHYYDTRDKALIALVNMRAQCRHLPCDKFTLVHVAPSAKAAHLTKELADAKHWRAEHAKVVAELNTIRLDLDTLRPKLKATENVLVSLQARARKEHDAAVADAQARARKEHDAAVADARAAEHATLLEQCNIKGATLRGLRLLLRTRMAECG